MNAFCIAASTLLLGITLIGADAAPAEPNPAVAPPRIPPLPEQGTSEPQPAPAAGTPTDLQEEIRQLNQRVDALERQLQAIQGPQMGETRRSMLGTLVVDNQTWSTHSVSVNGLQYSVSPGGTEIEIPFGSATVFLPYHELPKQRGLDRWRWNGHNFELLVEIRNR